MPSDSVAPLKALDKAECLKMLILEKIRDNL